jgi:hypothetical protein
MHRIDTANAVADLFGAGKKGFGAGNPATNTPATFLDKDWCNAIQEELAGIVEAKFGLDKADRGQVLKALKSMFLSNDQIIDRTGLAATALLDRFDVIHKYRADRTTNPNGGSVNITTGLVQGGIYKLYLNAANAGNFSNSDIFLRPNGTSYAGQFGCAHVNIQDPAVSANANASRSGIYGPSGGSTNNSYFFFDTFNGGEGTEGFFELTLFPNQVNYYKKVLISAGDTAGVMVGSGVWHTNTVAWSTVGSLQWVTTQSASTTPYFVDIFVKRIG